MGARSLALPTSLPLLLPFPLSFFFSPRISISTSSTFPSRSVSVSAPHTTFYFCLLLLLAHRSPQAGSQGPSQNCETENPKNREDGDQRRRRRKDRVISVFFSVSVSRLPVPLLYLYMSICIALSRVRVCVCVTAPYLLFFSTSTSFLFLFSFLVSFHFVRLCLPARLGVTQPEGRTLPLQSTIAIADMNECRGRFQVASVSKNGMSLRA